MKFTNFEDLPITTMTMVMSLSSQINMDAAFQLLPITKISMKNVKQTAKCKLPHCGTPGAILAMGYKDQRRGIIKNNSPPFKNAVTIDISTKKKNISVKLSPSSIQLCGASSREDGIEAAEHIIQHLKNTQHNLDIIHEDIENTKETVEWLKNNTRGPTCDKIISSQFIEKTQRSVLFTEDDNMIVYPQESVPGNLNYDIVKLLMPFSVDYAYHSDFCRNLDNIIQIERIADRNIFITLINEAMINYNYSLNFKIDRTKLNKMINGKNGFVSRYNNGKGNSVTVESLCPPNDNLTKRRKNKVPHHTFLVYLSGAVTMSGSNREQMKYAYYNFMETINEMRSAIEYKPEDI